MGENKESNRKNLEIKSLSEEFWLYSNPMILLSHLKGGKRAEASQWSLEIRKMLRGIVESVIGLENVMNQTRNGSKLFLDSEEIIISDEKKYWLTIYVIDNAILRIYACLEKIAQMCRCYFEDNSNGGNLEVVRSCGCKEPMNEDNCSFGSLITYFNTGDNKINRNSQIIQALNRLNSSQGINNLRPYRNSFTHKRHAVDSSAGLDPKITSNINEDQMVETKFSLDEQIPSINWFRAEIVHANNAIVQFLSDIGYVIFPRDFKIKIETTK